LHWTRAGIVAPPIRRTLIWCARRAASQYARSLASVESGDTDAQSARHFETRGGCPGRRPEAPRRLSYRTHLSGGSEKGLTGIREPRPNHHGQVHRQCGVGPNASGDLPENIILRRILNTMQLLSSRIHRPRQSPEQQSVPYSSEALRQDLQRVRSIWDECQSSRDRNAIYAYLSAVYSLVAVWAAEGREIHRARRALRLQRLEVSHREDPFGAVIRCTADPAKADKRTRSKWSRAMRYAAAYKPDSEPLDHFIRRKGGINACAARFSRCLGRGGPRR
jgi:hypothetical protein